MSRVVYIAGPMTGIPEFNFPAFDTAASKYRALGYTVMSPAEMDRLMGFDPTGMTGREDLAIHGFSIREALVRDLETVTTCNGIILLKGWEQSKGARAELALAAALEMWAIEDTFGGEPIAASLLLSRTSPMRDKPRLIALSGYKQSGKDVIADELVKLGWVKIGMSDVLHECMTALNPVIKDATGRYNDLVHDLGYVKAKEDPEVRRLLQAFGTDLGREILGEDIWIEVTLNKIHAHLNQGKNVVLTGVRFPNEAAAVQVRGRLIRVTRPGYTGNSHASERSLDKWPFSHQVVNDGSLEDLQAKARELARDES